MKPYIEDLKKLKHKLINESDFSIIANYFFDIVEQHPIIKNAKIVKNKILIQAVMAVGESYFNGKVIASQPRILHVNNTNFYHGAVMLNDCLSVFCYFEDLKKGMLSIHDGNKDKVIHVRITGTVIGKNKTYVDPYDKTTPTVH
ncbi:hypothetical protein LZ24_02460 [Desulfobotulus alkaliphilus]|uniref:Uncharacterized protein n=1 Tax=Desulfobotulus alkaliphilus TaxID=622671 RepID=A0A562RJ59_9BACT|nr:hypothetical protein [Desulfobotulus alkaliphilus]TWI68624.1 hypothetical protein LZ24_02460 [Desulfobotulus alkaliphilus]